MGMPTDIETVLNKRLEKRVKDGSLRRLKSNQVFYPSKTEGKVGQIIDFCSNDYLGFAKSIKLKHLIDSELKSLQNYKNGSGGSRLLAGNTGYAEEVEKFIAAYHLAAAGLLFNSGYDANLGLLSSIPQRGDTIISDELIHASVIDGCRLSLADRFKFKHNDVTELEAKLNNAKGNIFVVVESVYSMDGDLAPLEEISSLCERFKASLIVDEAHATGVFGPRGSGLVTQLGLETKVLARIITFGKALGTHGAIVIGSKTLREYLINFARSFIYTTAAPMHNLVAINSAYQLLENHPNGKLHHNISLFNKLAAKEKVQVLPSVSAIQGVVFSSNKDAKAAEIILQKNGFDVRAILSPTVPTGTERIRICIHQYNTEDEIRMLIENLKTILHG